MRYTVKAAARATGIAESRLRTWERRYGIPSPGRSATGRRLYDEDDIVVIRRMASLVNAGMSAAEAAEAARAGSGPETAAEPAVVEHRLAGALAAAAEVYDETAFLDAMREGVSELGWASALDGIVFPALKRVGLYWETAVIPPANEHFASELVRRELAAATISLSPAADGAATLLLACPEEERHDLGLSALALLLRKAGLRVVYLGADVPTVDLLAAFDTCHPEAICLAATSAAGLASLVRASRTIVSGRHVRLFVGGPALAYSTTEVAGIRMPHSLQAAGELIVKTVSAEQA
jgi:MerR family transcriptional regulator, light-induced transcriptional regulator